MAVRMPEKSGPGYDEILTFPGCSGIRAAHVLESVHGRPHDAAGADTRTAARAGP
jgi:hypothetical protein